MLDEKKKLKARMYLKGFNITSHYTFVDLYMKHALNIVPIVALDFSLANLSFDSDQKCIHTLKEGSPNDYIDCMTRVFKAFDAFSRQIMPIGFGARTLVDESEEPACALFSLTGDITQPYAQNQLQLRAAYEKTLKSV